MRRDARQFLDDVTKTGLLFGGAFGLYLAWLRVTAANRQAEAQLGQSENALRQTELARRDHVAKLFNRAVGQLGDPKLEIRLGAVYTLRQISRDFPEIRHMVSEFSSAHMRECANSYGDQQPPADVREIMAMIVEPEEK